MAAKHHITVAEMYEGNAVDLEKVMTIMPLICDFDPLTPLRRTLVLNSD